MRLEAQASGALEPASYLRLRFKDLALLRPGSAAATPTPVDSQAACGRVRRAPTTSKERNRGTDFLKAFQ